MIHERHDALASKYRTCGRRLALTMFAVAGLVLSGCHHSNADSFSAVASGPNRDQVASISTEAANRAPAYAATMHPCDLIDHQVMAQVFGPDGGAIAPPRTDPITPSRTSMTCTREYGEPGADLTIVALNLILADPNDIRHQYDSLRRERAKRFTSTDITNLGQGAYSYTDPGVGQTVTVFGGNLLVDITIHPVTGHPKPASTVTPMLVATARHVMVKLGRR